MILDCNLAESLDDTCLNGRQVLSIFIPKNVLIAAGSGSTSPAPCVDVLHYSSRRQILLWHLRQSARMKYPDITSHEVVCPLDSELGSEEEQGMRVDALVSCAVIRSCLDIHRTAMSGVV